MPIYAYRCSACGHEEDKLQKMSDPLLTVCPACGQSTYVKQVTAAGFQLKGSGWYVTDFRNNGAKPPTSPASATAPGAGKDSGDGAAKPAASESGAGSTSGEAKSGDAKSGAEKSAGSTNTAASSAGSSSSAPTSASGSAGTSAAAP